MNEAEVLFTEILKCDRPSLYLNKNITLDKKSLKFISLVLKNRLRGHPLEYILGKAEFMGLKLKITRDVLIPRPETEILVETALGLAGKLRVVADKLKILDIGTGSGCIAVSLAKFIENVSLTATDISEDALKIAKENALLNNVKINFLHADLFDTYDPTPTTQHLRPNTYDLIISNPPYVPSTDIMGLQPEVRCEPRLALDGGPDGLDFYHKIINSAPRYSKSNGLLILEMGFGQRKKVEKIFQKSKKFEIIEVIKDYSNIDRVIVAKNISRKTLNSKP